jgi:DNA-binding transcriptional LysR family regulator
VADASLGRRMDKRGGPDRRSHGGVGTRSGPLVASAALSRSAIILRWHCSAVRPRSARPKPERLNAHPMPCIHRVLFCPTSRPLARRSTTTDSLSSDEVRNRTRRISFRTDGCAATVGLGRGRPALVRSVMSRPSTSHQRACGGLGIVGLDEWWSRPRGHYWQSGARSGPCSLWAGGA